jgi:methyl-accepting chemotaxis protein
MKEGKSQKNFKISIRAKILTGMIACVLIVTNLIGWFFIVQAKDTLLEQKFS